MNLPTIKDTPPGLGRKALLLKKLRLCCYMFDASPATMARIARLTPAEQELDAKRRETKRMTLLELINYYTSFKPCLTADEYAGIFDMLAWNLFRALPPSSFELHVFGNPRGISSTSNAGYNFSPEEDPQQEDPNWSHIQIAYEFLLRLVSFTPNVAQTVALPATKDNPHPEPNVTLAQLQTSHKLLYSTYLSRRFILSLLANFSTEDIRERDYLKTIIHRIYGSSMALRPFIRSVAKGCGDLAEISLLRPHRNLFLVCIHSVFRRNIQHIILRTVYEDERQHGISELLEILGSIINGFAVPLKDTHIDTLLCRILLPLHKVSHLSLFHPQLSYAVMQFLEKDPALANIVLVSLLKMWPQRNSKKEVLFVAEVEEVLERVPEMTKTAPPLHIDVLSAVLSKIAACVCSTHFQVSEKAIYCLNAEVCKKFVFFGGNVPTKDFRKQLVPILARAIYIKSVI
jgi:serine/threonine-protein phosphatase 2A regulatory subunit B'